MPTNTYRVKQGETFGRKDRPEDMTHAGDTVELTAYEAAPLLGTVLEGPVSDGDAQPFDVSEATVGGVLDAVEGGHITAADALQAEREGDGRVTLIRELEAMTGGPDDA